MQKAKQAQAESTLARRLTKLTAGDYSDSLTTHGIIKKVEASDSKSPDQKSEFSLKNVLMSAVNKQLQSSVSKRFDHAAQLFLKGLKRTQGYSHVQAYELAYVRQLLTARWTKITVQSTVAT